MSHYTFGDAARILKVSPRRLRYWQRTALIRLRETRNLREGQEAAGEIPLEFRDLVCLKAVLGLIDQGIPLRRIRRSVESLREHVPELEDPLGQLRLWAEGSPRVVIDHAGGVLEPDGQMMLDFRAEASAPEDVAPIEDARSQKAEGPSALEWFERGCELDSDPASYAEAAEAYRTAIEREPDFADAYCNLGAVLYNSGDREAATGCFERCLELDAGHVEGHFNLANLLEEKDANEAALRHYRAAVEADPLYAEIHVNLGLLYEKLGLSRRARDHWRRYLQLDPRGSWSQVAKQRLDASKA